MQSWKACYYLWWVLLPLVVLEALGVMLDAAMIGTEIGADTGREGVGMGSDTGREGFGMGSDTGREGTTARAGLPEALAEDARTESQALADEACTEPEDNGVDAEDPGAHQPADEQPTQRRRRLTPEKGRQSSLPEQSARKSKNCRH
ncbi:hypothetical protein BDR03DRAFT_977450 [Suillus americanus]|nr:hypothetical protein BDR03DRAFT_977450 [Suillus americanus]